MKSIIVFLIVFSIIVVIHEFGHYYFAKRAGILVREFSLGMGPKLFAKQGKDGTTYTIRMLPLGGYVRLAGLSEEDEIEPGMEVGLVLNEANQVTLINIGQTFSNDELPVQVDYADLSREMVIEGIPAGQEAMATYSVSKQAKIIEKDGTFIPVAPIEKRYESVSVWHKLLTNFGGPLNNFILSIVVFTVIGFIVNTKPTDQWNISQVAENSAAAKAQLQAGDIITQMNGVTIDNWDTLTETAQELGGKTVPISVLRDDKTFETTITLDSQEDSSGKRVGKLGIFRGYVTTTMTFIDKLTFGFIQTWTVITGVFGVIVGWFTQGFNVNELGGPVAMAQMTNQVVSFGIVPTMAFLAGLSANLGIMNLLPIPALDGGKIILNLIEGLRGKPLSQEKEGIITLIGVGLLVILMVVVTWNDISRLFQ